MLPVKEFAVLDINAEHLGVPAGFLMENAGRAVAEVVSERYGAKRRIAVVCGPGNNGGDGFVAARHLKDRNRVSILVAKPIERIHSDIARDAFEAVKDLVVQAEGADLSGYDVIVDAVLGTGVSGRIQEPYSKLIDRINESGAEVVSVDVPSGFGGDMMVHPDLTVTFHDVKEGMTEANSGDIVVKDIGIPTEAAQFVGPGEFAYYPLPAPESHKGDNGRVLIVGGGPFTGAPALAAMGAYRIKVDLVRIAVPERAFVPVASYSPNFIVHELSGRSHLNKKDVREVEDLLPWSDAMLIGPGLGEDKEAMEAVRDIIVRCDKPLVIDADAVQAVSKEMSVLKGKRGILTPHAGEFKRLTGIPLPKDPEAKAPLAMELAKATGMTVLLKGRVDVIACADRVKFNRTGNAGMTVGGTGDVLAGIATGLLARGLAPFDAARLAAFVSGTAGDMALQEMGYGFLATDVAERIPRAVRAFIDRFLYV
ncbi:MAG: NAD(P)H-hydrate dehydratase [Methanomassiliicoccales archaeon]|nr:NAD(P)H-hydrate dehydratase [Methanomassiliicoccales archaeon]